MCLRTPYPIESIPDVFEKRPCPGLFCHFLVRFFVSGLRKKGAFLDIPRAVVLVLGLTNFNCVTPFDTDLTPV